jgi:phosphoserine phosphatase
VRHFIEQLSSNDDLRTPAPARRIIVWCGAGRVQGHSSGRIKLEIAEELAAETGESLSSAPACADALPDRHLLMAAGPPALVAPSRKLRHMAPALGGKILE